MLSTDSGMSQNRDRIFGIDFSGARTPASSIWVATARRGPNGIEIENCRPMTEFEELSSTSPREDVYGELRRLIRENTSAVFGFDFPFSLPATLLDDVSSWREHLDELQRSESGSATKFREDCVELAEQIDGSAYLCRETDWRYGGWCPYQYQIQSQTYYGQRDLLGPLVIEDEAVALPMQDCVEDLPWLIEVYPAATLSVFGLYRQGYKNHPESSDRRWQNIEGLREHGIEIGDEIAEQCRKSDDAHDSLIAAVAAYHALRDEFPIDDGGEAIEGQIFA